MDIRVDREQFLNYTKKHGLQKTLDYCRKKFPELKLYDISVEWFENEKLGLPCTVYGECGSLVVWWESNFKGGYYGKPDGDY